MLLEWGASEEDLRKLSATGTDGQKNEKKRKDIIRRMVKMNPNLESNNKIQKSSWLERMPKLVIHKEKAEAGTSTDIDLNDCFALVDTLGT